MSSTDPYSSPNLDSTTLNTWAGLLEPLEASVGGTGIRPVSNGVKPILNIGYGINMSVPERLMAALYAMTVPGTVVNITGNRVTIAGGNVSPVGGEGAAQGGAGEELLL